VLIEQEIEMAAPHLLETLAEEKPRKKQRPEWRQRLVLMERGVGHSLRQDSVLFVHTFTGIVIILMGLVAGLSLSQWALLSLALTLLFAAELMNQALRALASAWDPIPPTVQRAVTMSAAAVMFTWLGVVITSALTLTVRWQELL